MPVGKRDVRCDRRGRADLGRSLSGPFSPFLDIHCLLFDVYLCLYFPCIFAIFLHDIPVICECCAVSQNPMQICPTGCVRSNVTCGHPSVQSFPLCGCHSTHTVFYLFLFIYLFVQLLEALLRPLPTRISRPAAEANTSSRLCRNRALCAALCSFSLSP